MAECVTTREAWEVAWDQVIAPQLSRGGLGALRAAVESLDPALIRWQTVYPRPTLDSADDPPLGACAVGLAGWRGEPLHTIGQVEAYFMARVARAEEICPDAMREFVRTFDAWPPEERRARLLPAIDRELARRAQEVP